MHGPRSILKELHKLISHLSCEKVMSKDCVSTEIKLEFASMWKFGCRVVFIGKNAVHLHIFKAILYAKSPPLISTQSSPSSIQLIDYVDGKISRRPEVFADYIADFLSSASQSTGK